MPTKLVVYHRKFLQSSLRAALRSLSAHQKDYLAITSMSNEPLLSKTYYPGCQEISRAALQMINNALDERQVDLIDSLSPSSSNHDQPSKDFLGPF